MSEFHRDAMLRLVRDIQRRLQNEEYGTLPLRGVQEVERIDMEHALISMQSLNQRGGLGYAKGKEPKGKAKELFEAVGLPTI